MEWIQVTGRTVAEALEQALDELGVDEADIEYEVVEEPKRGLFGLRSTGMARIRARVKPISREKPDRRRRSGPREGGRSRGGAGGSREPREPRGPREARPPRAEAPAAAKAPPVADEDDYDDADDEDAVTTAAGGPGGEGAGPRKRNRKRRRGPRRPPGAGEGTAGDEGASRRRPHDEEESSVTGSDVSIEEQADLAAAFTRGLVERFGLPATVTSETDGDDDVTVNIEGDDLGVLIGPRAATLDAVQELVRTTVQRRIGGHGARVHVDVQGYRARRHAALAEFSRQAAQKAIESGRPQVFEPMSPGDRKVVHDTVNEIEGVQTVSEGEEPRRRVVIKAV